MIACRGAHSIGDRARRHFRAERGVRDPAFLRSTWVGERIHGGLTPAPVTAPVGPKKSPPGAAPEGQSLLDVRTLAARR